MSKEVNIKADACKDGLSSILLQEENFVAYVSQALTDAKRTYTQIDKELHAMVYACV